MGEVENSTAQADLEAALAESAVGSAIAALEVPCGLWRREGYAELLVIGPARVRRFDYTQISCLAAGDQTVPDFWSKYDSVQLRGEWLTLYLRGDVTPHRYQRVSAIPEAPHWKIGSGDQSRLANFTVLWSYFAENYPFFVERSISWPVVRDIATTRLASLQDDGLFDFFVELLEPFQDAHVKLIAPERQYHCFKPAFLQARQSLASAFGFNESRYRDEGLPRIRQAIRERALSWSEEACDGLLMYGITQRGKGYLNMLSMWGHAGSGSDAAADTAVVEAALDRAFAVLSDVPSLILDLRFNGGGHDAVALAITSRLLSGRKLAFSKRAVARRGRGATTWLYSDRQGRQGYDGPVTVLTSPLTASAAENLIIALEGRPATIVKGEATAGALSDVLWKQLPNGWRVGLSNEIFLSPSGRLFEGPGVPIDRLWQTTPPNATAEGVAGLLDEVSS